MSRHPSPGRPDGIHPPTATGTRFQLRTSGAGAVLVALGIGIGIASGCRPTTPATRDSVTNAPGAQTAETVPLRSPPSLPPVPATDLDPALRQLLESARSVAEASPASAEGWGRYGQTLEAADAPAEARICYARAAELDPSAARWPHLLGLLQLQDDPEAGLANLARAVAVPTATNDAPRVRLVQALVERGRFEDARPHLDVLLARLPNHAAARLELARIQLAGQQVTAAAESLAPCLTNPHTARPAMLLLSQVRAREGLSDEARALAGRAAGLPRPFDWPDPFQREVQALRPDRARQAEQVHALLGQRRYPEADALLAKLLQARPEDPELLLLAGRSLLQQRRCPEAEARFRAHLRASPDSLNGLIQLAISLLCQQRWADAEGVLEQAIAVKPDFAQAHANLGLARSRLGNSAGAIRSYRDALRCTPGDPNHHAALAEELARTGDRTEALRHADQALAIDPAHARARAVRERLTPR